MDNAGHGVPVPVNGNGGPVPANGDALQVLVNGDAVLPVPANGDGFPVPANGDGGQVPANGDGVLPVPANGDAIAVQFNGDADGDLDAAAVQPNVPVIQDLALAGNVLDGVNAIIFEGAIFMGEGIEEIRNLLLEIQDFGQEFLADAAILNLHGFAGNFFLQSMNLMWETLANLNAALADLIELVGEYNIVAHGIQEANQNLLDDGAVEAANQPEEMDEDMGGLILEDEDQEMIDIELQEVGGDQFGQHNHANQIQINHVHLIQEAGQAILDAVNFALERVDEIEAHAHALQPNDPNLNVQMSQHILENLMQIDEAIAEIQESEENVAQAHQNIVAEVNEANDDVDQEQQVVGDHLADVEVDLGYLLNSFYLIVYTLLAVSNTVSSRTTSKILHYFLLQLINVS